MSTIRVISSWSSANSAWIFSRPSSDVLSEAAWTASSFIRSRMLAIVWAAPSAICSAELACSALRAAWFIARRSARIWFAIPSPAASSAARLMR